MKITGTCPKCGYHGEIEGRRRPIGEGTEVDPMTPLSYGESLTLQFVDDEPLPVRGVQQKLILDGHKRNYQQVERELSRLVGRKLIRMNVDVFPPRYYR